jgi:hypothetical protein
VGCHPGATVWKHVKGKRYKTQCHETVYRAWLGRGATFERNWIQNTVFWDHRTCLAWITCVINHSMLPKGMEVFILSDSIHCAGASVGWGVNVICNGERTGNTKFYVFGTLRYWFESWAKRHLYRPLSDLVGNPLYPSVYCCSWTSLVIHRCNIPIAIFVR